MDGRVMDISIRSSTGHGLSKAFWIYRWTDRQSVSIHGHPSIHRCNYDGLGTVDEAMRGAKFLHAVA